MMCQRTDRRRSGTAYPRQLEYPLELTREFTLIFFRDDARRAVQVAPARVVTQAAPVRKHLLFSRGGKRSGDGK